MISVELPRPSFDPDRIVSGTLVVDVAITRKPVDVPNTGMVRG